MPFTETGKWHLHTITRGNTEETQKETHTARANSPAAEDVCVSVLYEEDYYDFARAQPAFTTPDAWARMHWDKRDREYLVGEWKQWTLEQARQDGRVEKEPEPLDFIQCVAHVEAIRIIIREIDIFRVINALDAENSVKERVRAHFEREN